MKRCVLFFLAILAMGSLGAFGQHNSARDYYNEAKNSGALPTLPYVCFRTSMSIQGRELKYTDPTFVMLGTTQNIADLIERTQHGKMRDSDREKVRQLRSTDFMYVQAVDHGVQAQSQMFERADPRDPSKADWVFQGTFESAEKPVKWEFNINWGTLNFREKLTIDSASIFFYGQCESAAK